MKKIYMVDLTEEERQRLQGLIASGKTAARKLTHARILLKADRSPSGPNWPDWQISQALDVGRVTVERVRKRFIAEGLESALNRDKPQRVYQRKIDGKGEAHLVAVVCSPAPEGYQRWTLQLLADRLVELGYVDSISYETVRRTLKKTSSSLG
ncbi:MAG: helix-turn-helix domain-containing protein [Planctomycetes bacterium]|nr:helix-turn-helix domain-containing protein [Planctomycetota bacterium]